MTNNYIHSLLVPLVCLTFFPVICFASQKTVIDYGADPTGRRDSTKAIQSALSDCGVGKSNAVYIPAGTFTVSSTLTTYGCPVITGAGSGATSINNTSPTAPTLVVNNRRVIFPSYFDFVAMTISGFTVTRTATAQQGATGISLPEYTTLVTLRDVISQNNYIGFLIGPAEIGLIESDLARNNYGDGFYFTNAAGQTVCQWHVIHAGSVNNDGWGFHAVSTAGQPLSIGAWYDIFTFGNTMGGAAVIGSTAGFVGGSFGITDSVFAGDGGDEIAFAFHDNPEVSYLVQNTYAELAGVLPTGRYGSTPASHKGNGVDMFDSNGAHFSFTNVIANGNSGNGFSLDKVLDVDLNNVTALNNGQADRANYSGLFLGTFSEAKVTGGVFSKQHGGIAAVDGANLMIANANVTGNSSFGLSVGQNESSMMISNVSGYSAPTQAPSSASGSSSGSSSSGASGSSGGGSSSNPASRVFVLGTDGAVYQNVYSAGAWSGWNSIGGALTSAPSVIHKSTGEIDVFARGTDNALWEISWNGDWSGWTSLGGALASAPAAVVWPNGRIDVFALGADSTLYHRTYIAGAWSDWSSLGGALASAPSAVIVGGTRLDVFARGTDNALWHLSWNGDWSAWSSLGGAVTSTPSATAPDPSRLDVFARGTDNALWEISWNGDWSGWNSIGGTLTSGPTALTTSPGSTMLFVRGAGNTVYERIRTNGTWADWVSLGGNAASDPSAISN